MTIMQINFLQQITHNLEACSSNTAFCIQEQTYTYRDFAGKIGGIAQLIQEKGWPPQARIGVVTSNRLETYATIIALWMNRMVLVPISPANPIQRNAHIIKQTTINRLIAFEEKEIEGLLLPNEVALIETKDVGARPISTSTDHHASDLLYILFTSGSSGFPKGVPINKGNLEAFIEAFLAIGHPLGPEDRFLQPFDFTFDVSVQCYVLPLLLGASIYPVPQEGIKFLNAVRIMKDHQITFANLVPSTLAYLKPYFEQIHLPKLKYSLFAGEALSLALATSWAQCVPQAIIENHYGPTEATILSLYHRLNPSHPIAYHGVVAIGKPYPHFTMAIMDKMGIPVSDGEQGELWISGPQITPGYWNNEAKNATSFAVLDGIRYYKTGDLVQQNERGEVLFCGRIDHQVQIQGYRVECQEVAFQVQHLTAQKVWVDTYEVNGVQNLVLFVEQLHADDHALLIEGMRARLPAYMVPSKIISVPQFKFNLSGKIDRQALRQLL